VIDHRFCESYAQAKEIAALPTDDGTRNEIVLVRDDDYERSWAYIEGGKIPDHFTDANGCDCVKVPKRFNAEVARA